MGARLVAACTFFASACQTAPTLALADFAQQQLAANCTRLVRCGAFENADACAAFFHIYPNDSLGAAVAGGQINYDGAAAYDCVAALAAITCDVTTTDARLLQESCVQTFTGQVPVGGDCAFDLECTSHRCTHAMACDASMCCAGSCVLVIPGPPGSTCQVDADCLPNTFCGTDLVCHALGKVGETCMADSQCDYGLGCVAAMFPTCQVLGAANSECPTGRCADVGMACVSGTCIPAAFAGASCPTGTECSPFEFCNPMDGTCTAFPDVDQPCAGKCQGDAWCDLTLGKCEALLANDAACDTDLDCQSGFCEEMATFDQCKDRPVCK